MVWCVGTVYHVSFAHNGTDLCELFGGTDVVAMLRPGRLEFFLSCFFSFFFPFLPGCWRGGGGGVSIGQGTCLT